MNHSASTAVEETTMSAGLGEKRPTAMSDKAADGIDDTMALTAEQVAIVKSTAPVIAERGLAISTTFYRLLLAAHPELLNMFSLRIQHTGEQQQALARAVAAYAAFIDDLGKLATAVEHIAQRHASLLVKPEHYPIVGRYLVAAFAEELGSALTPAAVDAWTAAYGQLAGLLMRRERELYGGASTWPGWRGFRIARCEPAGAGMLSLYMEPTDGGLLPRYRPGQYVTVRVPVAAAGGLMQCRQFSLSAAPTDAMRQYRVTVKRDEAVDLVPAEHLASGRAPGLVSDLLHRTFAEGDTLELSAPRGYFCLDDTAPPTAPMVLLSVGVGATPLLAMLETVAAAPRGPGGPVSWLHGARAPDAVCFATRVAKLAARHDAVRTLVFASRVKADEDAVGHGYDVPGRLSLDAAASRGLLHLDDPAARYYLCGPSGWMAQSRAWLVAHGVERARVAIELFGTGDVE